MTQHSTDTLSFLLNGERVDLHGVNPATTLLNWLRYERGLTGTKEGCAEGDCGACTVVLAEAKGDSVRYRAVNACILFLATLAGKEVLTVDALAEQGQLHPVQQQLADLGGSQCGFCTPGFVMSLFGHHLSGGDTDRSTIKDVIAGNLCRCTGYGPIIAAGMAVQPPAPEARNAVDQARRAALDSLPKEALALEHTDSKTSITRRFFAPTTRDDLADLLLEWPDATVLAGSTDVGLWVTKQDRILETVVYIGRVAGFDAVMEEHNSLCIGAGATYSDAMDRIAHHWPDFGEVVRRIGSVQIRNAGTIGGNIANGSPIGDSMPVLIALGAQLRLRMGGASRVMALEDFFIDYGKQDRTAGEFVDAVDIPLPEAGQFLRAGKISKRFDQDISALLMGFSGRLENGVIHNPRLAFGGMAATPKRARRTEEVLDGAPLTDATLAAARAALAADFQPISDMRASAEYRLKAAGGLLARSFMELQHPGITTRVVGGAAHQYQAASHG